jgi:CubicO group peptidase (beta-lactamase class C family)
MQKVGLWFACIVALSATIARAQQIDVSFEDHFVQVAQIMGRALDDSVFSGAAISIGTLEEGVMYEATFGHSEFGAQGEPVSFSHRFDMASVTKVTVTTTAMMQLVDAGKVDLQMPVVTYLPEFAASGKSDVTVYQLLTHTSGFIPFRPFHTMGVRNADSLWAAILSESPVYPPGTDMRYSDFGFITLGKLIERVSGMTLDAYARQYIFEPAGMRHASFSISGEPLDRVVATEEDTLYRMTMVRGQVHDETAFTLGGTAGHAGLFASIEDMAAFARMLLREGVSDQGGRVVSADRIRSWRQRVNPGVHSRAIGWDTRSLTGYTSAGDCMSIEAFGHTGFTGTSIWVDPLNRWYVVLLTNRVHPTRANRKISPLRPEIGNAAVRAIQARRGDQMCALQDSQR